MNTLTNKHPSKMQAQPTQQSTIASKDNQLAAKEDQLNQVLAENAALSAALITHKHQEPAEPTVPTLVETINRSNSTSELSRSHQLELAALNEKLTQLQAAMAAQAQQRPALAPIQEPTNQPARKPPRPRPPKGHRTTRFCSNNDHCWSHGFDVGNGHTSATCKNPKEGHRREATVTNQLGGDQTNCHLIPNN